MTPRKPSKKTPSQLADGHWDFIEGIILEEFRLTMRLFKEGFIHGYKHGKEDTDGVRSRKKKK